MDSKKISEELKERIVCGLNSTKAFVWVLSCILALVFLIVLYVFLFLFVLGIISLFFEGVFALMVTGLVFILGTPFLEGFARK